MLNTKYISSKILGGGKAFIKDTKIGEKFTISEMSAEEIQIETSLQLDIDTIVKLKIRLDSILFEININALGKVVEKQEEAQIYKIEFIDMKDNVKEEIDDIIRRSCN
ncbi:MAG TPA: hypothetical protein VIK72_02515 [Clostridiaceae bacterium]